MKNEKKKTILVVDDVSGNIDIFRNILFETYNVIVAKSGQRALEIVKSGRKPDLILLDIVMPNMDGYEVCRRLKSSPATRDIPIIFVSGKDSPLDITKGLTNGAADYITKPINPLVVKSRIKTHIELSAHRERLQQELQSMVRACVNTFGEILSCSHPQAFARASRLKASVSSLAKKLKLNDVWKCEVAAGLSQIGCVLLPRELVESACSGDTLSPEDEKIYANYPELSHQILSKIPYLKECADIVLSLKNYEIKNAPKNDEDLSKLILGLSMKLDDLQVKGMTRAEALSVIRQKFPMLFDEDLNQALGEVEKQSQMVSTESLSAGMVLASNVYSEDGTIVLPFGTELSDSLILKISQFWKSRIPGSIEIK